MAIVAAYPVASAIIGTMLVGTAVQAYGQYQQGRAQNAIARANADAAEEAAADAKARGAVKAMRQQIEVNRFAGAQRAAAGATGAEVDVGSPLRLTLDTADLGRLDVLTTENDAVREAWGYDLQATNYRFSGREAKRAGATGATGTLLTGAGSVMLGGYSAGLWGK